jgi:hypothetical protein
MSYERMDHADWVQRQIPNAKRRLPSKPKRDKYNHTIGWAAAPDTLSPFHEKVMDILGIVGGGIYNCPISWDTIDWDCAGGITLIWRGSFATWDFAGLTRLVFLCHIARIRCDLSPCGPMMLRLTFHQRSHEGGMAYRHPGLGEAVKAFVAELPEDHRIFYSEPTPVEDAPT